MTETPLDLSHAAMMEAPDDDTARLRFYERVADAELFVLLEAEPVGDQISPKLLDVAPQPCLLVFDLPERLAEYAGGGAPFVALSGRAIAGMLQGQGLGMAINLDVAPSAIILPDEALTWLTETLDHQAAAVETRLREVQVPKGLPEVLITSIDAKLATATGMATSAWLVGVVYDTGARGHLLAFMDAADRAQDALVQAISEALTFSGIDAGALDVGFFNTSDVIAERFARVGLRFDLPQHDGLQHTPRMPGADPNDPPNLR